MHIEAYLNLKEFEVDNLILTDVDGVLLDWIGGFEKYMKSNYGLETVDASSYDIDKRFGITTSDGGFSYIQDFNHSPLIGQLDPQRDAQFFVRKMVQLGYQFIVITSLSKRDTSCNDRIENLNRVFGDGAFEDFVFLDIGEHKVDALKRFEGTGLPWIEDLPKNALDGLSAGLDTYLVNQTYNTTFEHSDIKRVENWSQLFTHIHR